MLRFLTTSIGFNNAVRCVAGLIGLTALFSLLFAVPNPKHIYRKPESWKDHRVWVDFEAFRYKPFVWFTASISFLFLGFYPVFFNLEEVSKPNKTMLWHYTWQIPVLLHSRPSTRSRLFCRNTNFSSSVVGRQQRLRVQGGYPTHIRARPA